MAKDSKQELAFTFRLSDLNKIPKRVRKQEQDFMRKKFDEWNLAQNDALLVEITTLQQFVVDQDRVTEMVELADKLGAILKSLQLSTSQIRNIFGTVRQVEMVWPQKAEPNDDKTRQAMRTLMLLKPRLAYQAKREPPVNSLKQILIPMIDVIDGKREYFQRFVDFFEAILAYHVAHGGSS